MLYRNRPARALILTAAIALLVAACSVDDGAGGGGDAAAGMTVAVAAPDDGAVVNVPFDVELDSSEPLGEPDTGNRHVHLYFDTDPGAADYDIVYGTSWQVTRELAPGEHRIVAALANPDHSLAGPTDEITVTVGESSPGGSPPSAAPSVGVPGY